MKKTKKLTAAITAAAMLIGGNIGVLPWGNNDVALPSAIAVNEDISSFGDSYTNSIANSYALNYDRELAAVDVAEGTTTTTKPTTTTTTTSTTANPDETGVYGDVNGTVSVTMADYLGILYYIAGMSDIACSPVYADLNCDGIVNVVDASILSLFISQQIPSIPIDTIEIIDPSWDSKKDIYIGPSSHRISANPGDEVTINFSISDYKFRERYDLQGDILIDENFSLSSLSSLSRSSGGCSKDAKKFAYFWTVFDEMDIDENEPNLISLTVKIPENTPAGSYSVGIENLEVYNMYGQPANVTIENAVIDVIDNVTTTMTTTTSTTTTETTTTTTTTSTTTTTTSTTTTPTTTKPVTTTTESTCIPGDVDGDGRLNMTDVRYITEYYSSAAVDRESLLTEEQKKAADANCDGLINSYDAYIVTKVYIAFQIGVDITDVSEYIAENFTYKCPTSEDCGYTFDEIIESPVKPSLEINDIKYEIDKTYENENVVEVSIYADDFDDNVATLDFHVDYGYDLKPYYTSTGFGEELKVETVGVAAECLSIVEDTGESIYISLINHHNYYLDGEIIKLYFIIPSDAEQGDLYIVEIKYEQGDMLVCSEDSKAHAYLFKFGLFDGGEIYIEDNYGTTITTTTTTSTTSTTTTSTTTTPTTTTTTSTTTTTTTTTTETTTSTTATSTTTPPTTTTVTTTTLPETGYSVIYNYIILAAAAMVIFGIYTILKNREEA